MENLIVKKFDNFLRNWWLVVHVDFKPVAMHPVGSDHANRVMLKMLTPPVGMRYVHSKNANSEKWELVELSPEQLNPCEYLTASDLWEGR